MSDDVHLAARLLGLIDLTSLDQNDDEQSIRSLCLRTATGLGHPAAVCVYPEWIGTARQTLTELGMDQAVRIATVANFPHGRASRPEVIEQIQSALDFGTDEIDLVFPWRVFIDGDQITAINLVEAARHACPQKLLKVILETGQLREEKLIRQASQLVLEVGADFLKTSTGKVAINATPEAARIMLEVIGNSNHDAGFKAAGGISTLEQARIYLDLAEEIMGQHWVNPDHFRIGASSLLDDLLTRADENPTDSRDQG
jgi:deoxyribose-phosphate aldolase